MWGAEEEITEFLEPLLARLSEVLGRRGSVESQLSALGAISSAAAAAGSGFRPYAAAVLPLLRSYMNIAEVSNCGRLDTFYPSLEVDVRNSPDMDLRICWLAEGDAALPGAGDRSSGDHRMRRGQGSDGVLHSRFYSSSSAGVS